MNIYIDLTNQFNKNKLRAILSSGQAVVLHHLAIMSKDGDWIIREDEDSLDFIIKVLDARGARYRFEAPFIENKMRYSRSARELVKLCSSYPELSLLDSHKIIIGYAQKLLPYCPA